MSEASSRLDRWLWVARFLKSRTRATAFAQTGRIRINGMPVSRAHAPVRPGDVLTFVLGERLCVVRIVALADRRGPASTARLLYCDLTPAAGPIAAAEADDPGAASSGSPARSDSRPPGQRQT
jgi:ribosome-associated heat shock protein Hsp15